MNDFNQTRSDWKGFQIEYCPDFIEWKGYRIPCRPEDGYIHATTLAKANGTQWTDYARLSHAQDAFGLISRLTRISCYGPNGLIRSVMGRGGTWVHPIVARELSSWIGGEFSCHFNTWYAQRFPDDSFPADPRGVEEAFDVTEQEPPSAAPTEPLLELMLDLATEVVSSESVAPEPEPVPVPVEVVAQEDVATPVEESEPEEESIDWASIDCDPSEVEVMVFNGIPIRRRRSDGYLDATAMCQANGKRWNDFYRLDGTQQFLRGFESDAGIPASGPAGLVQSLRSGPSRGTWVHRVIGLKLAAWLSVDLERRIYQWYADTAGRRPLYEQPPQPQLQPSQAELNLERLKTAEFGFSLLERIGGVTDRVRIQFTDMVLNILNVNNTGSLLQPQEDPFLCLSVAWRDVTGKEIVKGVDSLVGKKLAAIYREEFNEEPPKHMADVSGHAVPVNAYRQSWLIPMVRKVAISMGYDVLPGDDDRPVLRVVN